MKKWYIGTLIIAFALLSFVSKETTVLPNQKIVLQFSDTTVTSNEIENTVAIVTKQLLELGVNNIQIHKTENQQLQITYYSNVDVVVVKDTLSKEEKFVIDFASRNKEEYPKFPSQKDTASYNLDVFKIQDASDANSGFNGKLALEPRVENDRFFNPNIQFSAYFSEDKGISTGLQIAYKIPTNIAIAIKNTSYKIPEVRAGPFLNSTSL